MLVADVGLSVASGSSAASLQTESTNRLLSAAGFNVNKRVRGLGRLPTNSSSSSSFSAVGVELPAPLTAVFGGGGGVVAVVVVVVVALLRSVLDVVADDAAS